MDLDSMLAEAAPAQHVPVDDPGSPAAVSLYRRITAQPPAAIPCWRRPRVAAAVLTGAAVAAAGAAALALIPGSPSFPRHSAAGNVVVLADAARTAARQAPGAVAGPGRFLYVETIEGTRYTGPAEQGETGGMCVQAVQVWAAPDGSGRSVTSAPSSACNGSFLPSQTFPKGPGIDGNVYPSAADLPADPAALKQFIARHFTNGRQDVGAAFQFAGTFLQSGAPPRVRAALYRMIEDLPDIQSLGPMTDMLGRHGTGVGFSQHGVQDVLIFDPATSAVLEWKVLAADPSQIQGGAKLRSGEVISYTVYKASGVVDSITAVPPAAGRPVP